MKKDGGICSLIYFCMALEEISDNGLIYDRDLIALVEFILDENKNYIKKIIVYNKKEIMYERKEILD